MNGIELTAEQKMMVESVRKLRRSRFEARALEHTRGKVPFENLKDLAEIGIMGMSVPERFGGTECSVFDTVLVLEEVAKTCYVTAELLMGELGVQPRIIATYAPEHLKERYLPRVASGEGLLSICMTEPDAGTDVANYKTRSVISGDKVIVNGTKTLISRAEHADVLIVFTRVGDTPGAAGIGCVLVPKGTPGLRAKATYKTMAGDFLCDVTFEDCEVPLDHLILKENSMKTLINAFNAQRCNNAAVCLGLAEGALEESIKYMRERQAFGKRIGDFQGMRWKVADMVVQIEAARGLLYRAAQSADPFPDPALSAAAKIFCNEMANRVTSEAVQIHGGYGFTEEFAVSRHFRGARFGSLGGGTTETLRNYLGRHLVDYAELSEGIAL